MLVNLLFLVTVSCFDTAVPIKKIFLNKKVKEGYQTVCFIIVIINIYIYAWKD